MPRFALTSVTFAGLNKGDVIAGLDGIGLGARRIVEGTRREDGALRLVRPGANPYRVEWWLYPATAHTYTVERLVRPARRRVGGIVLVHQRFRGWNEWLSEDGRFRIWLNHGGRGECEHDHPRRITPELAGWARETGATDPVAREILLALAGGKRGYLCRAGTEHELPPTWEVWDTSIDDYLEREAARAGTFGEACAVLAEYLAGQSSQVYLSTHCRHGQPYSGDCAECDEDF